MWTARVLLAAVLMVCMAASADARRRHHGYHGYDGDYGERSSRGSSLDAWRARQGQGQSGPQAPDPSRAGVRGDGRGQDRAQEREQDRGQDSAQDAAQSRSLDLPPDRRPDRRDARERRRARSLDEWRRLREAPDWQRPREESRRARYEEWRRLRDEDFRRSREREAAASRGRATEQGEAALSRGRTGAFGGAIDKLVRGCAAQAAEFGNWPFDSIAQAVEPNDTQRKALDELREAAKQAAQKLAAECPQEVPAAPAARLEAAEQGIAATLAAYDIVEPKLQAFFAALNDEQKARLYREMAPAAAPAASAADTSGASAIPRAATAGAMMRVSPEVARMSHKRVYARLRRAMAICGTPGFPPACAGVHPGYEVRMPPRPALAARARNFPPRCATGRCARSSATCGSPARSALPSTSW